MRVIIGSAPLLAILVPQRRLNGVWVGCRLKKKKKEKKKEKKRHLNCYSYKTDYIELLGNKTLNYLVTMVTISLPRLLIINTSEVSQL